MGAVERARNLQNRIETRIRNVGKGKYGRVLKLAHWPEEDEYYRMVQITALGVLLFGFMGFAIYFLMTNFVFPT